MKTTAAFFLMVMIGTAFVDSAFAQTRIRFARGRTSTSVSSTIRPLGERSYVLGARYGQRLTATISSRSGCVKFGNIETTTSYITESGNNYFNVMNMCRSTASYTVTVSIY